ncbi:MAG: histidine kinase [Actinomycetia bacterium]|nr:histidine kinase [Actinomycetes bacterium]
MRDSIRSLLAQPRVPDPPVRVWRDWVLVGVLVPVAILEIALRDDVVWPGLALVFAIGMIVALLWRRTYPLAVVVTVFGIVTVATVAAALAGVGDFGLYVSVVIVLLPYALFRWASGKNAAIGMGIIVVTALVSSVTAALIGSTTSVILEPLIGSTLFLILPAALGALVRYETSARASEIDRIKLLEREQLARELHDSVAHHVSAIVIQAQAGYTVAAAHPDAAADALAVIEEEASRTLAEMRVMVGALRDDQAADLGPQRGVADIERLASNTGSVPSIEVELSGDLGDLPPSVDTAIYRLAQESITNAVRHARGAAHVEVLVAGGDSDVRLTVADDGTQIGAGRSSSGYGIVGMEERATLLGGTFDAGPGATRGWTVTAVIPKSGGAT